MAKIVLDTITGGYDLSIINNNFDKIETELNNKVLYRDPPAGEANTMEQDLDMNNKSIYNTSSVATNSLTINGQSVVANQTFVTELPDPIAQGGKYLYSDGVAAQWKFIPSTEVTFTPTAGVSANTVQAAIEEVYNDFNSTGGAALVGFSSTILNGATAKAGIEAVFNNRQYITPTDKEFGAVGDGVANDTAALQAAIDDPRPLYLGTSSKVYKITAALTVPANKVIIANEAVINAAAVAGPVITLNGSNITIEGTEVRGPVANDTYQANSFCFKSDGTVGSYLSNIKIRKNIIKNFGQTAIWLQYCDRCEISNNFINYCGYAGVQLLSVNNTIVSENRIDRIYPGSGGGVIGTSAAYGVHVTRDASKSLALAPRSDSVVVKNNIIDRITTWEGVDTHGGINISFVNNTIRDCWVPVNIIHADGGGDLVPAQNITISSNIIQAGSTPGAALYLKPASTTTPGTGGSIVVSGNSIFRHGTYDTAVSTQGAIYCENCVDGATVTGNTFFECKYVAIVLADFCYGISITGNVFKDIITVNSVNRAIACNTANISAVISSNTFIRTSGSMNAIYIGFSTSSITVSADNTYQGTITKFVGEAQLGSYKLAARAWGNINGSSGATRDAVGLSVSRTGTGAYTVTLSEAMASTNYVPVITANQPISFVGTISSTTQFTITTQSSVGVAADAGLLLISVFGD